MPKQNARLPGASPDAASTSSAPGAPEPCRRLQEFLLAKLSTDELDELVTELRERHGYKGTDPLCVLEYCVTAEDPVELLRSRFTARSLRCWLVAEGAKVTDALCHEELVRRTLEQLGFPAQPTLRGLATAQAALTRLRDGVARANLPELRGQVVEAAAELELVIGTLLRFLCAAIYGEQPDAHFQAQGRLEASRTLESSSLGKLFELLGQLARDLERPDERVAKLQRDFAARRLAPTGTEGITRLRNGFAHCGSITEATPIADARRLATSFYEEALAFLAYLGDAEHRVFPHVVRIESVRVDAWGRRVVQAVSDAGASEQLFTQRPLEPGQVYLMHPVTNPVRVDPVLVPLARP